MWESHILLEQVFSSFLFSKIFLKSVLNIFFKSNYISTCWKLYFDTGIILHENRILKNTEVEENFHIAICKHIKSTLCIP